MVLRFLPNNSLYNVHWLLDDKFTIKRNKFALFILYPFNIRYEYRCKMG